MPDRARAERKAGAASWRRADRLRDCRCRPGTESSVRTHQYVAESAGFEVTNILDEPTAANAIYQISDGVVVDIGGGTTGLAIFHDGKVVQIEDEPTEVRICRWYWQATIM